MNEKERLEMLKNTGELKYLTKESQLLIWENNEIITWANYTVDKIKSLQQENAQLKEQRSKAIEFINLQKQPFNWEFPDSNFWLSDTEGLLKILESNKE